MTTLDQIKYPVTRKEAISDDFHGTIVEDPYRWMEDSRNPEMTQWITQQNDLVDSYMDQDLKTSYIDTLSDMFDYTRVSIPFEHDGIYFFTKNSGLQPQPVIYMRSRLDGRDTIVFDPNTLSDDGTTALVEMSFSPNARYLAMSLSVHGSDWIECQIWDLETHEFLPEQLENIRNGATYQWLPDSSGFYYSARIGKDEGSGGAKLWFHQLLTQQSADPLIFEHATDPEMFVTSKLSEDGKYLFASMRKSTMRRNQLYYMNTEKKTEFMAIVEDLTSAYDIFAIKDDVAYVYTNDEAPRGKIIAIGMSNTRRETWKTIIPEQENTIEEKYRMGYTAANNHLVITYLVHAKHETLVFDLEGKLVSKLQYPTMGTVNLRGGIDKKYLFLWFTSFTHPTTTYSYDIETQDLEPFHDIELDIDPQEFETKQVFYPSKDGTKIPMFVVHKKDLKINGATPTYLHGYGGFNISQTPQFSVKTMFWLQQGGIYASASIRGGGEYGEAWHYSGVLENKQNVFDDFIFAAEWLIANGYTNSKKLAIEGRSNGGLLTGAVALQRPDLFGAVLCVVGVLDMLRYHKYTIGRYWVPEYGNPQDPEHFKFLIKYSPLHNVKEIQYPPILLHTADTDDRVDPAHSKKFAATLQERGKGGPLLLRIDVKAGHGMGKPVTKTIEDLAYEFAFLHQALKL